ncbi:hypothetical protein LG943_12670 [Streptomonospora sp. S1-112]|uniref:Uncharacterized protein n=1 Tax=Streptomonospora mangrovi TaxID=2883123 RepID=A0A9X3NK12_9ACTN|nr:hypothetical protein [Streptomonospora mangrovi]MDA0565162.1 hypothetical protein [Streptomonospora mangrovi]
MNRYSVTVDARTPRTHDRLTDTTSPYVAHLMALALHATAVAIPLTDPVRITRWEIAPHARGLVITVECAAARADAARAELSRVIDQARHHGTGGWAAFTAWFFTVTEVRAHPANA